MMRFFSLLTLILLVAVNACQRLPEFHYDFEKESELDRLHWKCKTVFSLSDDHAATGQKSLEAEFYPADNVTGNEYPGLVLKGFNRDWRQHEKLVADIFNPSQKSMSLALRIDDSDNPNYDERFNSAVLLLSGKNHLNIQLSSLTQSGSNKTLKLSHIQSVYMFLINPQTTTTLYFDNIHLE